MNLPPNAIVSDAGTRGRRRNGCRREVHGGFSGTLTAASG
jgi:hypothetical protein